jgi:hypothetical protein
VQNPPFLLGRVIADRTGIAYLKEHCGSAAYVSCELIMAGEEKIGWTAYTEEWMWPFVGAMPFNPRLDPDQRERFYAEQWPLVIGAVRRDPWSQIAASFYNASK